MRGPQIKPRRILAFTAGFVLVAICAVAVADPPTPKEILDAMKTPAERNWQTWGYHAYHHAVARDRGMTFTDALASSRLSAAWTGLGALHLQWQEAIISMLYKHQELPPVRAQQDTEYWCLTQSATQQQTQPQQTGQTDLKYRY